MKVILLILIIVIGGFFYFKSSNKNKVEKPNDTVMVPEGEEVLKDLQGNFVFDTEASSAKWTGSKKIIKDYYDSGSIKIKSGNASFKNGIIENGEIVFDMTSISGEETSNTKIPITKLNEHLKSEDFFNVEMYPEATYKVTEGKKTLEGYILIGELTLAGKTGPLNVDIKTSMKNGNVAIAGFSEIDRSKWDIKYGSDSFFDNLGDNVINDIFTLEFKIVARP